jgi:hypothetical protein
MSVLVLAGPLWGCASTDNQPILLPPVTVTDAAPSPEGQPRVASSAEREASAQKQASGDEPVRLEDDPTVRILGRRPGEPTPGTTSEMLERAASDARDERTESGEPVLVINNDNLSELAAGGRVTLGLATAADPPGSDELAGELSEKEQFWRSRVLEIRQRWRQAYDSIDPLEGEAAKLRTRVYNEDSPVRRDPLNKPQWDGNPHRLNEAP